MADLVPPPQDRNTRSHARRLHRLDSLPDNAPRKPRLRWRLPFPERRMETAIQLLSRWAGPAALIGALCVIGWMLIG